MSAPDVDVIVIGAGPSGLLLAAELARLGVSASLLERRIDASPGSRAIGVHPPTLAALESSGATEQILASAVRISRGYARAKGRVLGEVRFDRLRSRFPFVAAVPQAVTEAAVGAGSPAPLRGVRVLSVQQSADGVVVMAQQATGVIGLRARAAVVAAGASGRELLSPAFGLHVRVYPDRYLMADIESAPTQPADAAIIALEPGGVLESFPLPAGGRRLVAWLGRDAAPRARGDDRGGAGVRGDHDERLRRVVAVRSGDEALAAEVAGAQEFGIRRMLLRRMRDGRVFAIGDAAHEVSPIGGQGMNLGLLDAATLAPALASWLQRSEVGRSVGGGDAHAALDRWESNRLASARTAARLASANTSLGRSRSTSAHAIATLALRGGLAWPLGRAAAHAYAMGFDRDAVTAAPRLRRQAPGEDELSGEEEGRQLHELERQAPRSCTQRRDEGDDGQRADRRESEQR